MVRLGLMIENSLEQYIMIHDATGEKRQHRIIEYLEIQNLALSSKFFPV
jgi:hypothetical protein